MQINVEVADEQACKGCPEFNLIVETEPLYSGNVVVYKSVRYYCERKDFCKKIFERVAAKVEEFVLNGNI